MAETSGGRDLLAADLEGRLAVGAAHDLVRDALGLVGHLLEAAADEALGRVDGVLGVGDRLPAGDLADQDLALVVPGHHRRGQPRTLLVGDHLGLLALHDRDDRVGGPEVDSDDLSHSCVSLCAACGIVLRRTTRAST